MMKINYSKYIFSREFRRAISKHKASMHGYKSEMLWFLCSLIMRFVAVLRMRHNACA